MRTVALTLYVSMPYLITGAAGERGGQSPAAPAPPGSGEPSPLRVPISHLRLPGRGAKEICPIRCALATHPCIAGTLDDFDATNRAVFCGAIIDTLSESGYL